jgi:beta-lactam-binding protein with PASTA domain
MTARAPRSGPRRAAAAGNAGGPGAGGPVLPLTAMIRIVSLALMAVALLVGAAVTAGRYLRVDDVTLPDVRGLPYGDASQRLRAIGLRVLTYPEIDPSAPPETVVSQTPPRGSVVRSGRTVSLGVNAAAEVRQAPTLVGLPEPSAIARAESVGVGVERISYVVSDQPSGLVIGQYPGPGSVLTPDVGLTIEVSRGFASAPLELPDVRGMTLDEARSTLTELGVRRVDAVAADLSFDRPHTVTDQRPAPGSEVLPSTPVTLVYALEGTRVVRVPEVVGAPLWQAQLTLRAAQLGLGPVRFVDDPTRPAGVLEVRPAGFTVVGSPVALVVNGPVPASSVGPTFGDLGSEFDGVPPPRGAAAAPEEPEIPAPGTTLTQADGSRVIPFRFDPSQVGVASLTREPYRLTLVVSDDGGERTILDRQFAAGESVATSVQVIGDEPLLQTFINGSFFQAWRP